MNSVAPKSQAREEQRGPGTLRLAEDRRRISRVSVELVVELELDGGRRVSGVAMDIGLGGMFIESIELPDYGSQLTVLLPHSGTSLMLPATVRWSTERGVGVQFGLLGARETHAIAELVEDAKG